jgi:hypothetical protein
METAALLGMKNAKWICGESLCFCSNFTLPSTQTTNNLIICVCELFYELKTLFLILEFYLRERDQGILAQHSSEDRKRTFGDELERRSR